MELNTVSSLYQRQLEVTMLQEQAITIMKEQERIMRESGGLALCISSNGLHALISHYEELNESNKMLIETFRKLKETNDEEKD